MRAVLRNSIGFSKFCVMRNKGTGSVEHILNALSPLDGRYEKSIVGLKDYFSEKALIKYRITVEIEWLTFLL